jgi:rhodanese-related sulfurtransferase
MQLKTATIKKNKSMVIKMIKIITLLVLVMIGLIGCSGTDYTISADDALELIDTADAVLLDVRTPSEYDEGHIEGAVLFPLSSIESSIETAIPDKSTEIIVYCRSGNRSADAVDILIDLGYTNVHDLGGIIDWPYGIVI